MALLLAISEKTTLHSKLSEKRARVKKCQVRTVLQLYSSFIFVVPPRE